jgi:hypothetical protein
LIAFEVGPGAVTLSTGRPRFVLGVSFVTATFGTAWPCMLSERTGTGFIATCSVTGATSGAPSDPPVVCTRNCDCDAFGVGRGGRPTTAGTATEAASTGTGAPPGGLGDAGSPLMPGARSEAATAAAARSAAAEGTVRAGRMGCKRGLAGKPDARLESACSRACTVMD